VAHSLQAPATNLGTWPATSTSHSHHRYTAAQPKPGRVSIARQPQLPPTGHPAAAAAAPKPAFQRSASRSLGPAVAAGQAAKSAAARLAAEPAVERSAASLPSAKGGWGAAVSPFAALSLGPSEASNNGEATAPLAHLSRCIEQPLAVLNISPFCPVAACMVCACVPPPTVIADLLMQRWECWRHRWAKQAAASRRARRWWCRRCMARQRGAAAMSSSTRCAQGACVYGLDKALNSQAHREAHSAAVAMHCCSVLRAQAQHQHAACRESAANVGQTRDCTAGCRAGVSRTPLRQWQPPHRTVTQPLGCWTPRRYDRST
jgi:hypothetical protein